jgi:hypothetical protein
VGGIAVEVGGIGVAVGGRGVAVGSGMNMLVRPQPMLAAVRIMERMMKARVYLGGMITPGCHKWKERMLIG